jgi:hypothetical protein
MKTLRVLAILALLIPLVALAGVRTKPPASTNPPAGSGPAPTPAPDVVAPVGNMVSPGTGFVGLPVALTCSFTDAAPSSGPWKADFYYAYCPGGVCGANVSTGTDLTPSGSGPVYTFDESWENQPSCFVAPDDHFRLTCFVWDIAGNVSIAAPVDVRSAGRGC